jgi:coatomer protein complex subunit alpha (xenin)
LKDHFLSIFQASRAIITGNDGMPSIMLPVRRNPTESDPRKALPALIKSFQALISRDLQDAYKATTSNKITEACTLFRGILHSLLLTVVTQPSEAEEVKKGTERRKKALYWFFLTFSIWMFVTHTNLD